MGLPKALQNPASALRLGSTFLPGQDQFMRDTHISHFGGNSVLHMHDFAQLGVR
jgi:hypothetical protein